MVMCGYRPIGYVVLLIAFFRESKDIFMEMMHFCLSVAITLREGEKG